ncbi:MAG TPA: hypothetical protein VIF62_05680, partial [Labilithrix sp.]
MRSVLLATTFAIGALGCATGTRNIAERETFPPHLHLTEAAHVDDDVPVPPPDDAPHAGGSRYGNLDKAQCE